MIRKGTKVMILGDDPRDVRVCRERLEGTSGEEFEVTAIEDLEGWPRAQKEELASSILRATDLKRRDLRENEARAARSRLEGILEKLTEGLLALASGDTSVRLYGKEEAGWEPALQAFDRAVDNVVAREERNADLLSMAVHDIVSPLNTIMLVVDTIENCQPDEISPFIDMIKRSGDRQRRLVESLMDLQASEEGTLRLDYSSTDMAALVRASIEELAPQANVRGQKITFEQRGDSLPVWCDADRISRVVHNLLGNALKFSDAGTVITVRVSCGKGGCFRFSVQDQGPGIDEKEQGVIFERYRRAGEVEKKVCGHGLGLAICQSFIAAHGGWIGVESTLGEGACFRFTLPVDRRT